MNNISLNLPSHVTNKISNLCNVVNAHENPDLRKLDELITIFLLTLICLLRFLCAATNYSLQSTKTT